jgi:pimeloyl-ACP methyl ester carboxylesterase
MTRFREYGSGPYDVAVLHGGPGAAGEMAPVARALSRSRGVLEALQTASTVEGQLEELASTLRENASLPVSLIGHSWGAMLGLLFTAGNPDLVKKLILVNSGVLENRYAADIMKTRLGRMTEEDRAAVLSLTDVTTGEKPGNKNEAFSLLGAYISKADSFDPLPGEDEIIECRFDIYESVWGEAQELRSSGGFTDAAGRVRCPVVAIHGDYDPHPPEGIREPLAAVISEFNFILLENCGHRPWTERQAQARFYEILRDETAFTSPGR